MTFDDNATILEGTWEEIAAHAPEWSGKRLRVAVEVLGKPEGAETNETASDEESPTLDKWLEGYIGTVAFEPTDVAARSEELWGEGIEEKHRRIKEQGSNRDAV